jgi:Zn-finger protein
MLMISKKRNERYHIHLGKQKCLWCFKVMQRESFMDLIEDSIKVEGGQNVHGRENITPVKEKAVARIEK